MREPFTHRLASGLIRLRWPLLLLALAVTGLAAWRARDLDFDRSIENMFAPDDPLLPPYQQLKRTFGGNEVVVAAYPDPQLMTPRGIARVARLTDQLSQVEGVAAALSLTRTPLGEKIVQGGPLAEKFLQLLEGYVVSSDRQTAAVVCLLQPEVDSKARAACLLKLRGLVEAHDAGGVLAGEPVMVTEGFEAVKEDGNTLGWVSTLLLLATLLVCFRSPRWTLLPFAVVYGTLTITQALLVLSAIRLSMVSSMLWAIVTVVCVATVMHLIVRFREERQAGQERRAALLTTTAALAAPVWWTVLTDATGFVSLLAASVGPVQDFGTMMALGSFLSLFTLALMVPGLALAGPIDIDPRPAWGEPKLQAGLRRLLDAILCRPKSVVALALALAAGVACGSFRLEVETDFTRNFRAGSSIVRSYAFVESNLGGAGVWDVVLPAPAQLDVKTLDRLRRLEQRLAAIRITGPDGQREPGLTKVLGLASTLDAAPDIPIPRIPFLTPSEDELAAQKLALQLQALRRLMPDVAGALYGQDPQQPGQHYVRIMLRSRERQSAEQKKELIAAVTRLAQEEFPAQGGRPAAQVTGFFVLLANLIESMVRDQWVTFGIALAAIGLFMAVAFRSLQLSLMGLVPNVAPILVVTGLMGWLSIWLDLKINMGAAMIAAVSVGLSVDSSIHYILSFQRLRRAGAPVVAALHRVQQSVGLASVFSTLALVVGFSALAASEFVPTIYFGVLVSLAMLGGLIGNLVILPLLLYMADRDRGGPTSVKR
jgi:hypothetical protein